LTRFGIILFAFIIDQLTKLLVLTSVGSRSVSIIGNILRLQVTYNTRGIFGISFGSDHFYFILPLIGLSVLIYLLLVARSRLESIVVGLITGGAFGNLIDRIRLGAVVDFIDMGIGHYRWPTYNLADAFITIGIVILIFYGFRHRRE